MTIYPSARHFMQAVVGRYRSLPGYSDTGQVRTRLQTGPYVRSFETKYRSQGDFRFVFECPHPYPPLRHKVTRYEVGCTAGVCNFVSTTANGRRSEDTVVGIDILIGMATGISGGSAYTVAGLLYEQVGGCIFSEWRRPRFGAFRMLDGVMCVCVSGIHPRGGRMAVYVGREDLLLRRVVDRKAKSEENRYVV